MALLYTLYRVSPDTTPLNLQRVLILAEAFFIWVSQCLANVQFSEKVTPRKTACLSQVNLSFFPLSRKSVWDFISSLLALSWWNAITLVFAGSNLIRLSLVQSLSFHTSSWSSLTVLVVVVCVVQVEQSSAYREVSLVGLEVVGQSPVQ